MKKKRILLIVLSLFLLTLISCYILFQISKSRSFQFFGSITNRVDTNEKVVALTFDDAPSPHLPEVLRVLKENQVKATFYAIGSNIEQYPEEAKAMVTEGMDVGNHSYSHKRFLLKSQSFIDTEIQKTNRLIRNAGYRGEITFRPPNGKKLFGLPLYLDRHTIKTITWDVEPDTYFPNGISGEEKTKFIVDYTVEHTRPGSIILLHPFCGECSSDRKAIGQIIKKLRTQGYTFVTISELLKYDTKK